jgi:hypothetical protein
MDRLRRPAQAAPFPENRENNRQFFKFGLIKFSSDSGYGEKKRKLIYYTMKVIFSQF